MYFRGTFGVDYLKNYSGEAFVKQFRKRAETYTFTSDFHEFCFDGNSLVKFDFSSDEEQFAVGKPFEE